MIQAILFTLSIVIAIFFGALAQELHDGFFLCVGVIISGIVSSIAIVMLSNEKYKNGQIDRHLGKMNYYLYIKEDKSVIWKKLRVTRYITDKESQQEIKSIQNHVNDTLKYN